MPSEFSFGTPNDVTPRPVETGADALIQEAIDRQASPVTSINTAALLASIKADAETMALSPAYMRGTLLGVVTALPAWVDFFMSELEGMRSALQCICNELEAGLDRRLTVVSTIESRPDNVAVTDGAPGPDIVRGGWVLFQDSFGNVGQRSYIIAAHQRHVSDLPNAVSYTYHIEVGFTVTFS